MTETHSTSKRHRDSTQTRPGEACCHDFPTDALLAASSEVHVLLDREGRVIYANEMTAQRLRCDLEQYIGSDAFSAMTPELAASRRAVFEDVVASKTPRSWTDCNGMTRYQNSMKPILDENGEVAQVAVFARDITESVSAQLQVRERERLLEATMESTADGILVVNEMGEVQMANSRFAELWRIPQELVASRDDERLLQFVLDQLQNPDAFLQKVEELYKSDAESFDTLLFKDERVFERYSCPLLSNDKISGRVWSFRDVTKREQTTAELKDTLARYRSLFEDAPIAIYEVDLSELKQFIADLKLTDVSILRAYFQARPEELQKCISLIKVGNINPSVLRLYEAGSREEFVANFHKTFSPEFLDKFVDGLAAIAKGNTLWKTETSKLTCAGKSKNVLMKVCVCPGYEKTLSKALISVVDITDRKEAEDALRSSESTLRTVINATKDAMISIGPEGEIELFNPAAEAMFGYSAAEMIGKKLLMLMPEEYRKRHSEYVKSYFATGKPDAAINSTVELPALHADGSVFPIEISLSAGESEGRAFVIAVLRDITERRRAQEAIEDSEQRFRDLVEHADIAIMADDAEGRLQFFNDKCAKLLGFSRSELAERQIDSIVHPEDRDWVLDYHQRRYRGEDVPTRYEFRGIRKDGAIVHLDISVSVLEEEGKVVGTRSYLLDITELKRVEAALRKSEELFQGFAETVTDVIYRYDIKENRLDFISPSIEVHTGYSVEEVKSDPWRTMNHFIHPADRRRVTRQFMAHLRRGPGHGNCHFEYRLIRRDGRVIWVSDRRDVEFDDENRPYCVNGVSRDITIQKLREQERLQLEAQMQQAQRMESLGVLAGGIAHEFNNMLGGILGTAELMLYDLPPESQLRKDIEQIMTAAGRAAHLTDQMLAYSGKGAFVVRPLNLSRVVLDIAELLQAAVPKGKPLEFELAEDMPATVADLSQMRQVLMNLVTNAAEAISESGGNIKISTGVVEADEDYLQQTIAGVEIPAGEYAYVEVGDDGSGIEHTTQARMFEPFFSTKFAGRGLGLAAVDGIVRGHNGTIKVDSEPQRGTRVRVLLPVVNGQDEPLVDEEEQDLRGKQGSILVADGEETTSYLARRILQRAGYRTVTATDTDELIVILRDPEIKIDLAMVDAYLPSLNSGELKSLVKELPQGPVFIMSGSDPQDFILTDSCCSAFVRKPYRPQDLLDTVQRALAERRSRESSYSI